MMIRRCIGCFLLVLPAILLVPGCEEKVKPSVLSTIDSHTIPQQESWNSDIVVSDSGRVRAIIHAGYIRVFESSRQTLMSEGVRVRFLSSEGVQTSVLTSDEGAVDETTNDLEARKKVYVVSSDSVKLWTEVLYWDNRRRLIHTPEFVRIVSPKEKLQGHGFESDQNLNNYRIFHVTGEAKTQ